MQTLTIGRSASNTIVLTDVMVSRHHAELIVLDNGQVILRDLGSSNGTFVNGNKIKECNLKPGDIVKCATTFLKWAQYVNPGAPVNQPVPGPAHESAPVQPSPNVAVEENLNISDFNFNATLKYIFTRIFSIGDLFKKEWNMTPSILFFLLTPVILILICCLIIYAKASNDLVQLNFAQIVILPVVLSVFIFGIPQFLTLSLLSIGKETNFTKNLFASSIFSFLQFSNLAVIGIAILILSLPVGGFSQISTLSGPGFSIMLLIVYFIGISAIISISVTLFVFIYKFFRVIGVTKGVGIHLTILAFAINSILEILFTYAYLALVIKDYNLFDSILDF
jgi:hypothetical protein